MSGSPSSPADIDVAMPARAATNPQTRIAVVDIGSNSVRLVVYEGLTRAAATVHNEKTICSIGRDLGATGMLHKDGVELALEALRRFRLLTDRLGVALREAVATAAARDASNGTEFVRRAEAAWGAPVRVLSGSEEAKLAGEGVIAAIPDADGLAADLGGGSLDMVTLKAGRTGEAASLPFGPLRLMAQSRGDLDKMRDMIDTALERSPAIQAMNYRTLYAVGGIWRSVARVDMLREEYPLHMLQHYTIPHERALQLSTVLAKQGRKSLELLTAVSKRRMELLPYGAVVLQRLLLAAKFKEVVVSANGVREGLLFSRLSQEERAKDPLLEFTSIENQTHSRSPAHALEMFHWASPLFADENAELRRLRLAVSYLSDVGWRRHPDHRARGTYADVLNMPFAGADHRARAFIATAIFHRYSGDGEMPSDLHVPGLLDKQDQLRALRIGLAARVAFDLSASAAGELGHYRLRMTPTKVLLEVPKRRSVIADDTVGKRMGALGEVMDRKPEILVVSG
ncbi:MAG: Ppx/GppA family phosphatase [Alphaproteobacteria bacterium]|nr:Ppx/GppA family phosphatase [Alphaproteobacteria bacterium]